jgi:hypothetical protein
MSANCHLRTCIYWLTPLGRSTSESFSGRIGCGSEAIGLWQKRLLHYGGDIFYFVLSDILRQPFRFFAK